MGNFSGYVDFSKYKQLCMYGYYKITPYSMAFIEGANFTFYYTYYYIAVCVCVYVCTHTHTHTHIYIYIHKSMVQFEKLIRNLFLTSHGHNVHRKQQQLSKFLMR